MIKKYFLHNILIILGFIIICSPKTGSAKIVEVGVYNNKPLVFIDNDGNPKGIFIDILEYVASKEQWELKYIPGSWTDCLARLEAGEIDLMTAIAYSKERKKKYNYTYETVITNWGQVFLPENSKIKTVLDLESKKIAVKMQDIHFYGLKDLTATFNMECRFIESDGYDVVFELIEADRVHAGVVNRLYGIQNKPNYPVKESPIMFNPIEVRYASPKTSEKDLLTAIDVHLSRMQIEKDPFLTRTLNSWLEVPDDWALPNYAKYTLVAVGFILIVIIAMNLTLRIKVKTRTKELLSANMKLQKEILDRKKAEAAAIAHQEQFKTFFSSVNDAIFVHPLQKEGFSPFIEVNDIACMRYGYTRDEFLKLTAADITKKVDADKHAASKQRKKLLERKNLFFEAVHIKKNGDNFPVEINSNIVRQYGGPVILSVVRDISERKKAEKERESIEVQYRQAQKVEAIGRLAGGIAHDLNNILTPIIGYGELLISDMGAHEKNQEAIKQIVQAGFRARDLVRQLLAFGRKQTLEYKITDLNKIIEGFKNLLRSTIREDIEIEFILPPNIPAIKADIGQIEQVIMNLCVNAQDAMLTGGKLTLMTSTVEVDEKMAASKPGTTAGWYVMLSVSDSGCGIDPKVKAQIFEPFFSTKGEHGTGLGLSTVYGIVKQHGGNIWVDSRPGIGSTFKVYLPVSNENQIDTKADELVPDDLKGPETILLVEDSEQVRNLSRDILTRQGYTTLVAENGAEALKILADHSGNVDLILTDVVMPDMNGKDLYTIISKEYPDIKVLYMSGYTHNVIAHHGVLDQGVNFIQKPFSVQALSEKIRKVLG